MDFFRSPFSLFAFEFLNTNPRAAPSARQFTFAQASG
jgi:hypothetical protein